SYSVRLILLPLSIFCFFYHLLYYFFCLSSYGYLRALRSFPTRRSSDLIVRERFFAHRGAIVGLIALILIMALAMSLIGFGFLGRSEEHTSELQSRFDLVCRLLLEKKKPLN